MARYNDSAYGTVSPTPPKPKSSFEIVKDILCGRRIVEFVDDILILDIGVKLRIVLFDGWSLLDKLIGCHNVITNVKMDEDFYKIFVFAAIGQNPVEYEILIFEPEIPPHLLTGFKLGRVSS